MGLTIKIHRGSNSIGGTITEIYTDNTHIFIDFGAELNPEPELSSDRKMIEMIQRAECDAVLFSHYHGDHIGLLSSVPKKDIRERDILLGLGDASRKVLINIHKTLDSDFIKNEKDRKLHQEMLTLLRDKGRWVIYESRKTFEIGDIKITPLRIDHSAYDAYMFVIESGDKCIVHTGDYRMHGRLGDKLFNQVKEYLKNRKVDILITEGTMMERRDEKVITEEEMESEILKTLKKTENKWAFLVCSSTNVESLASFHNAAMKLKRPFIVNRYVYEQIKLYRETAGKEDKRFSFKKTYPFENMEKTNPKLGMTQPEFMRENGFVMLVGKTEGYKKRMEYFLDLDPLLFYSMWEGYIDEKKYPDTYDEGYGRLVKEWRCDRSHTSGHAPPGDIKKMIEAVSPKEGVIPIHTTRQQEFKELVIDGVKVIPLKDGMVFTM